MKHILFTISIFTLLSVIKSRTDADDDRRTKALACITLVKAALHHNQEYFESVSYTIDTKDQDELTKRWTFKTLLNCFNTVSLMKSAELIGRQKFENVSPFATENAQILDIENYHNKYLNDAARLTKDTERLEGVLKEVVEQVKSLEEMVRKPAKELLNRYNREKSNEESRKAQEEAKETDGNYENGRLNLGLVTKMNPAIKYGLGLGLLALMFLSIWYGLNKLTNKGEIIEKKKKKKN